jgi:acyl-CoA oxidase
MGYLKGNRFAALKADTDVFTTFEGDNTVLLQLAAKNLLTDFRDQLGELDPLGTASFFAGQVFETVAERSAMREVLTRLADDLLPGRDDQEDLASREVQLDSGARAPLLDALQGRYQGGQRALRDAAAARARAG